MRATDVRLAHAAAVVAVALQAALIVYGIAKTATVVHVNHLFPHADKAWHLLYYAVIASVLWLAVRGRAAWAIGLAIGFGALDEGIQALTPGRSGDLADLAVDGVAAFLAVGVIVVARRMAARRLTAR